MKTKAKNFSPCNISTYTRSHIYDIFRYSAISKLRPTEIDFLFGTENAKKIIVFSVIASKKIGEKSFSIRKSPINFF